MPKYEIAKQTPPAWAKHIPPIWACLYLVALVGVVIYVCL